MEMLAGSSGRPLLQRQFIREDLVQNISMPEKIGIVVRLPGDSTMEISNEDVDRPYNCIPAGFAQVVWLKSQETNEDVKNLRVIDRSFVLGDVVAPLENHVGQTGIVLDISMSVDLELNNGELIEEIDSCRLRRVRSYMPGDYVIHNNWLGRVEEVMDNVTVMFDGGAKCKIFHADIEHLVPIQSVLMDDRNSPYYPGQKVRGATPGVFKVAKWLKGAWNATRTEGTICAVEVGSVLVLWITSALTLSGVQPSAAPAMLQKPSSLLPLMYTSHTNWQLGDWVLLPLGFDANEHASPVGDEKHLLDQQLFDQNLVGRGSPVDFEKGQELATASFIALQNDIIFGTLDVHKRKQNREQKRAAKRERKATMKRTRRIEHAALVIKTKTKVDVLWQDGTKSCGIEASSLVPIEYFGDHEFWPEQYVLDRGLDGEDIDHMQRRVGIVKSVDATQRTAVVQWLQQAEKLDIPHKFSSKEIVSVYEVVEHPHFNYRLGDVVVRLTMEQPKLESNECGKGLLDQGRTLYLMHEVAQGANKDVEQEIESDKQPQVANDKDIELPQKEKWAAHKRGRERRYNCSNYPIVDLSWVGNVIELKDGEIKVVWANGNISKVGPTEIFVVSNENEEVQLEENEFEILYDSNYLSWASMEYNEDVEGERGQISLTLGLNESSTTPPIIAIEVNNCIGTQKCSEKPPQTIILHKVVEIQNTTNLKICNPRQYKRPIVAACKKLVSRMTSILHNLKSQSSSLVCSQGALFCSTIDDVLETYCNPRRLNNSSSISKSIVQNSTSIDSSSNINLNNYLCSNCNMEMSHPSKDVGHNKSHFLKFTSKESNNDQEVIGLHSLLHPDTNKDDICNMELSKTQVQVSDQIERKPKHFKQFDSVYGATDHHFVHIEYPNLQRKWIKKIHAEWEILENNLPDSIYVRVYEDRMDLLRATIVGAQGTPYHDNLFVFDFHLPQEFPLAPPVAYFHSGGLRLNPNLYENGNVCLSLLNTWAGKGTEVWDASNSSILQLLISIQGLVLNSTPYFNEAGYEKQMGLPEGERNSFLYNENVFLSSCKSMMYLLRRPPQHFERIIRHHFSQRGPILLKTCAAYMNGASVGSVEENSRFIKNASGVPQNSTMGFRIMLEKLLLKLTTAFADIDIQSNCSTSECIPYSSIVSNA